MKRPPDKTPPGLPNRECLEFIRAVATDLGIEQTILVVGPRLIIANTQEVQVHTKDKTTHVSGQRACEHPEAGGADHVISEILTDLSRLRKNQSAEAASKGSGLTDYYLRQAAENCAKLGDSTAQAVQSLYPKVIPTDTDPSTTKGIERTNLNQ